MKDVWEPPGKKRNSIDFLNQCHYEVLNFKSKDLILSVHAQRHNAIPLALEYFWQLMMHIGLLSIETNI